MAEQIKYNELQEAYESCVLGGNEPDMLVTNGAILNQRLGVETFDPAKAYYVTKDGIREAED